ncbi:MAG: alpha-amylase, partial [Clostridia bacterium]|nr:alpha-amylase [Clostridia bacterium]
MRNLKKRLAALLASCLLPAAAFAGSAEEWTADVPALPDADVGNDIVFYEIFTPSFSDSDGDGIGDLQGVLNRLDYLNDGDPASGRSLGVDGIWLTPIFLSPSYHKYDVTDYGVIDPAFGDLETLSALIEGCHERNLRLILDLPINHTGYDHAWFQAFAEAHRAGDTSSPYYDFYVWAKAGEQPTDRTFCALSGTDILYEANFSPSMPELDFENTAVREAVLAIAEQYLAMGVDGFRFDAAKYVYLNDPAASVDFWRWYTDAIRTTKPDAYLVAEVWDNDAAVTPYDPYVNCFAFQGAQSEGWIAKAAKAGNVNRFTAAVSQRLTAIRSAREDGQLALFIANHDMDRAAGYL